MNDFTVEYLEDYCTDNDPPMTWMLIIMVLAIVYPVYWVARVEDFISTAWNFIWGR